MSSDDPLLIQLREQHEKQKQNKNNIMKLNQDNLKEINNLVYQLKSVGEHREKILTSANPHWLTVYLPNVGDGFKDDYLALLDEKEKQLRKELKTLGFQVN